MGYGLPCRRCSGYIGKEARYYSFERGATSTPRSVWLILQHLLPAFEFAGSSTLVQVGLMNLDPLRHLNGRATKFCMIQIYIPHRWCQIDKAKNGCQLITSLELMMR